MRKEGEWHVCAACGAKMRDDTLEKTYQKLETNFRQTVKEEFSDVLFSEKLRSAAMLRSNLWRELGETYIDVRAIGGYAKKIRDIFPDDAQANFYYYAMDERWNDVNKLLKNLTYFNHHLQLVKEFQKFLRQNLILLMMIIQLNLKICVVKLNLKMFGLLMKAKTGF